MIESNKKMMLWLVAGGFFMQMLDTTIVNTALPAMALSLKESPLAMHWAIIAYTLTMAIVIPASGWLADGFGLKKINYIAITLFTIGSLFCALSTTLNLLIVARIVQGIGGALLLPVGRLALLKTIPANQYVSAMSFVAVPSLVGPLIGPVLGGWLVQAHSWHWIFIINLPIGLLGLILNIKYMPTGEIKKLPFDSIGYILLAVGMAGILFSLDNLEKPEWSFIQLISILLMACGALILYSLRTLYAKKPLFSRNLFQNHQYCIGLIGNFFARIGSHSTPYLLPLLLQVSLGFSPFRAGMLLVPASLGGILVKRFLPYLLIQFEYRKLLIFNTLALGVSIINFSIINTSSSLFSILVLITFFGIFNSIQFTAMNALTLKDLNKEMVSGGNAFFSMIQMLALSFGVTVSSVLLEFINNSPWVKSIFNHLITLHKISSHLISFKITFICIGILTCLTAWIFAQVKN